MKFFYKKKLLPIPTLHNKKKISANFGPNFFGLKLEKSAKNFGLKIGRNFFINQSGYGEQTLFYKIFPFIIEKISSVQWFHFWKQAFMIFLSGATKSDFFEIGMWNYKELASKPHIPFLWRIFLRLGSTSSCCEYRSIRIQSTSFDRSIFLILQSFFVPWKTIVLIQNLLEYQSFIHNASLDHFLAFIGRLFYP